MPVFGYKGIGADGRPVEGKEDADTPRTLRMKLKREGIFVTSVSESKPKQRTTPGCEHRVAKGTLTPGAGGGTGGGGVVPPTTTARPVGADGALLSRATA